MKYFGEENKQNLIESIEETEVSLSYRQAEYDVWLDGRGYCIAMTAFGNRSATHEEITTTLKSYETVEELIDDYILYDGVSLAEACEMDAEDFLEF